MGFWPGHEHVLITQGFGLTESSAKLYGYRKGIWTGKHAGIDFRANNDRVLAMADGVVAGVGKHRQCLSESFYRRLGSYKI